MKPRLCLMTSVVESLSVLLRGQPAFLAEHYDVTLVTSPSERVAALADQEGVRVETFELPRTIAPHVDLRTLRRLARFFRSLRPQLVQTYTPKAGLIGMLAARLAGVPHRVHGIVGMPLMEATGARRAILGTTERTTYTAATHLTCNSHGLQRWVRQHLTRRPVTVIGHGSINGIDTGHWRPRGQRDALRAEHAYGADDVVFVFVGRLVRDKGIVELVEAFADAAAHRPGARLLLVGHEEPELDPLPAATRIWMERHPGIQRVGFVDDVRPFLELADAFVLPSYREGLPNSLLEAGAMGLPCVVSDINGCNEVILDGQTGSLVPAKSVDGLSRALGQLVDDPALRIRLGAAARESVVDRYDQPTMWRAIDGYYRDVLAGGR